MKQLGSYTPLPEPKPTTTTDPESLGLAVEQYLRRIGVRDEVGHSTIRQPATPRMTKRAAQLV